MRMPPMELSCALCERLWPAYAKLTAEHVRLVKEREEAEARGDTERFRALQGTIGAAEAQREASRRAIAHHLAMEHSLGG
jgi:hypothetical protein